MSRAGRPGFTLLEAAVALAIVSVAAVAALTTLAAELRTAERVRWLLPAVALAEDRLAALALLPAEDLTALPDSLARGRFEAPFEDYAWRAGSEEVRGERGLVEVRVAIEWSGGSYALRSRLYRPEPGRVVP